MNQISRTSHGGSVKSASRCLDLLELLVDHGDGLTLSEIGERLGWPKSSTLALVRTLVGRGFMSEGRRERSYRLGPRIAWLGSAYLSSMDLVREGQDVVCDISRQCDETVHLATLEGAVVRYLAKEEGNAQVRMVSAVGKTIPAHATGVGKVLIASLTPSELEHRFPSRRPLEALTDRTITDRATFLAELETIRERGYATDDGESTVGLRCVAGPVRDKTGSVIAAISISVPSPRFTVERSSILGDLVLAGCHDLSQRLGWLGPDPMAGSPSSRPPDGASDRAGWIGSETKLGDGKEAGHA